MSFHADPKTAAENLARHLEMNYGLQLDPARHQALVTEVDSFFQAPEAEEPTPAPKERKPKTQPKGKA